MQFEHRTQMGAFQIKAIVFEVAKHFLNGLITNDKFCLVRWGKLRLSHWRRPLRLRQDSRMSYSAQERKQCGGNDETPMAGQTDSESDRGWPETMGSSLPAGTGDCKGSGTKPGKPMYGGKPCE
jgi:hypothetical protein